jgi:hypothetical protein
MRKCGTDRVRYIRFGKFVTFSGYTVSICRAPRIKMNTAAGKTGLVDRNLSFSQLFTKTYE